MSEELIKVPCQFGETGNFLLERALGTGGMGGVYLGRDKMLDRPVAVKVMLKEYGSDAQFVETFKKEAQAAAKLLHPNIAQIYSYGLSDGMPYIAMELATGGSLESIMKKSGAGKTDVPRVMKICQQVAQALACAADFGLVHGDVKPENILLDANGNAKLVDFGLAAMAKNTDEIWGTPFYISPEKVKKEPVDYRADMYSLGGTLYHALTGVPPFDGKDTTAVVKARFLAEAKKPSEVRPGLSPQIDALVMKMLAFDKDDRFPSFEALIEEFKQVMTTGLTSTQKVEASKTGAVADSTAVQAAKPAAGGKKIIMKKKPGAKDAATDPEKKEGEVNPEAKSEGEGEEDEGGNIGLKIAGVVGAVIGVILLVVGGLVWYKAAERAAEERAYQQQIVSGIAEAKSAIKATSEVAEKFVTGQVQRLANEAIESATKLQPDFEKLAPKFAAEMNPGENGEKKMSENAPQPVKDMRDLWDRAYQCKKAADKLSLEVKEISAMSDSAQAISGDTEEDLKQLGELSREANERFEAIKGSKETQLITKELGFINQRGPRLLKSSAETMRVEALKAAREAKKEAEKKAKAEKEAAAEAAKKAEIETEIASIKDKFQALADDGRIFKQLDWKSALRQMETIKAEFKHPESEQAADLEIGKVNVMKSVQDIFIANLKGYKFAKSKLKNHTIVTIDEKDIVLTKPDGGQMKLTWPKFYQGYHGNLNEIIIQYIEKGRQNCNPKLNLKQWSDGMMGAAMTLRLICNDDPAAASRGDSMAKEVGKKFPDLIGKLKAYFPDLEFEGGEEEE